MTLQEQRKYTSALKHLSDHSLLQRLVEEFVADETIRRDSKGHRHNSYRIALCDDEMRRRGHPEYYGRAAGMARQQLGELRNPQPEPQPEVPV